MDSVLIWVAAYQSGRNIIGHCDIRCSDWSIILLQKWTPNRVTFEQKSIGGHQDGTEQMQPWPAMARVLQFPEHSVHLPHYRVGQSGSFVFGSLQFL
jgi:hypothetical protein